MEKQRRFKVFSIVALMFAVVALSVGFAAFQKIMNISSNANVALPNEEKIILSVYGTQNFNEISKFANGEELDFSLWENKVYAYDVNNQKFNTEYSATISNDKLTVNNDVSINIDKLMLKDAGEEYYYFILLKNNNNYGVYISLSEDTVASMKSNSYVPTWGANCTGSENVTSNLVNDACNDINLSIARIYTQGGYINLTTFKSGKYKLLAHESIILTLSIAYSDNDNLADGEFYVSFPQIKLNFGLTSPEYIQTYNNDEDA